MSDNQNPNILPQVFQNLVTPYLPPTTISLASSPKHFNKALLLWLSSQRYRSTLAMCDRCATIESAFGLRDPLPPRVATLDAETVVNTTPSAKADHERSLPAKNDTHQSFLRTNEIVQRLQTSWLSDSVTLVWQLLASTLSGIRDSRLTHVDRGI